MRWRSSPPRPAFRSPSATRIRRSARRSAPACTTSWRRRRSSSRQRCRAPDGGKARAYLRERGLSPETQKRFRLGYAPASRNALKEHLAAAGISQEQMIEAGLLIAGEDIPVSYDRFRDRIIFPITDFRGRVIAFGGRALSRRRAGEIPELAGDAALPQEPRPLQRPGRPRRLAQGRARRRRRGLYRRDRLRRRRLRGDGRAARHGADRRPAPHALADGGRADPLLRRRRGRAEGGLPRRASGARRSEAGEERQVRAAARRAGPRRFHSPGGSGSLPQDSRRGKAAGRHALAERRARARPRHAGAPRRPRADACARRWRRFAIPMSAATTRSAVRERVALHFGAAPAGRRVVAGRGRGAGQRAAVSAAADRSVGEPARQSDWCGGAARSAGPSLGDARAARRPHPPPRDRRGAAGIARRTRTLPAKGLSALAGGADLAAGRITRRFPRPSCARRWHGAGHGEAVAAVLEKLRQAGLRRAGRRRRRARRGGLGRRCPLASAHGNVIYRAAGSRVSVRSRVERRAI